MDLGFGNCYHMQECFAQNHVGLWMDALKSGDFSEVFKTLAENNFQSGSDLPFCAVFEDFMKTYPDAKVLLTVRDNPEKWVESWKNTVRHRVQNDFFIKSKISYHQSIQTLY